MEATALTVIHKYIRQEMFVVSAALFRAGPEDVTKVQGLLEEVVGLLEGHAQQEEARFEPLLQVADPSLAERMATDHRRLDAQLAELRAQAGALDGRQPSFAKALLRLHLDWNRLVGAYLAHLDEEERVLFVPIADKLPPVAHIAQVVTNLGNAQGKAFLDRLWPAVTPEERAHIERALTQA
jgi:hypothetical protein